MPQHSPRGHHGNHPRQCDHAPQKPARVSIPRAPDDPEQQQRDGDLAEEQTQVEGRHADDVPFDPRDDVQRRDGADVAAVAVGDGEAVAGCGGNGEDLGVGRGLVSDLRLLMEGGGLVL